MIAGASLWLLRKNGSWQVSVCRSSLRLVDVPPRETLEQ